MTMRQAAGLDWSFDGEAWIAEDDSGTFKLVELGPGEWMDFWWKREESCGCGTPAKGGGEWPDFDSAARAVVALAREEMARG